MKDLMKDTRAIDPAAGPTMALVRLLQLASPALPIGAYSYSQGLEWAVDAGTVHDAATAATWIGDLLDLVVAPGDRCRSRNLCGARRRRVVDVRTGQGASDGTALFPLLT